MSDHKHVSADNEKGYEEDVINFSGILYFGLGLFLLIVITFGLMWIFQFKVLEPHWAEIDAENENPLARTRDEKLPPEPRLQSAPGFGVVDPKSGRVNLELREPQAEYRELQKQWNDLWENGEKDEKTGTVVALPIEEAKKKILESGSLKSVSEEEGKKALKEVSSSFTSSSSGRVAP